MEISSHHSRLLQQLNEQRRQDIFCDCQILVEGKPFKAHRNVLFASSGYFKMLLSQSSREPSQPTTATFEVFSPETFHIILDFVYTGMLALDGQTVIEVMSAASYLQMTDVIHACKTFIKSSLDINEKDQDSFSPLSNQDIGSNGDKHSNVYNTGWRAGKGPAGPQPAPEQGDLIVTSSSWSHYNSQPLSQSGVQQQKPYLDHPIRKWGTVRKPRQQPGRPHFPDTVPYEPQVPRDGPGSSRAPAPSKPASAVGDIIEIDEDEKPAQECKKEPPSHEEQDPQKPIHALNTNPYSAAPAVQGEMGDFGEDGLPRVRFKCPHCPHTVKRRADMKRHLRCHTGERPYPCPACGKGFTRLEHLRGHFQTIHEACKLLCRKCKCSVTEATGRVVQQGTRRYRLCYRCLEEAAADVVPVDGIQGRCLPIGGDEKVTRWLFDPEHNAGPEMSEDGTSSALIIHKVEDSDEDSVDKSVGPAINE